tara:strand:+ start:12800 stop:14014 length:1215 start_codon:yes stop_codon:yes gene_type:complete
MKWVFILFFSYIYCFEIPNSLIGKTFIQNGPRPNKKSILYGLGEITTVHFKSKEEVIVSSKIIPKNNNIFKHILTDVPDSILTKIISIFVLGSGEKMNTCNTAIADINGSLYAVEETSSPFKINIDNDGFLQMLGFVHNITMAAHQPKINEFFSYLPNQRAPLSIMGFQINWFPKYRPAMIHDCKKLSGEKYIFPISALRIGNIFQWLFKNKTFPLKAEGNFSWLVHETIENNNIIIDTDLQFTNVFHIAECKQKSKNIIEVWAAISSSEMVDDWINNDINALSEQNHLCKFIIDLKKRTCKRRIYKTQIEFAKVDHKSNFLIGLKDENTIVRFNKVTETSCEYKFKERISELCIIDDDIHYIYLKSDDIKGESSVVISDKEFKEIYSIEVPYREHTFHSFLTS